MISYNTSVAIAINVVVALLALLSVALSLLSFKNNLGLNCVNYGNSSSCSDDKLLIFRLKMVPLSIRIRCSVSDPNTLDWPDNLRYTLTSYGFRCIVTFNDLVF